MVVHTFFCVVPGHCLRAGFMEGRNFFVLRPILVKFHIRTRLIEGFPREHGSWSWAKEKLLIPLEAHDKAQLSEIFQVFFERAVFFMFWLILLKLHI